MTVILKAKEHVVENESEVAARGSFAPPTTRVTVRVPYRSIIVLTKWITATARPQYIEYTVSTSTQNRLVDNHDNYDDQRERVTLRKLVLLFDN